MGRRFAYFNFRQRLWTRHGDASVISGKLTITDAHQCRIRRIHCSRLVHRNYCRAEAALSAVPAQPSCLQVRIRLEQRNPRPLLPFGPETPAVPGLRRYAICSAFASSGRHRPQGGTSRRGGAPYIREYSRLNCDGLS
jgi:hypothetical protein